MSPAPNRSDQNEPWDGSGIPGSETAGAVLEAPADWQKQAAEAGFAPDSLFYRDAKNSNPADTFPGDVWMLETALHYQASRLATSYRNKDAGWED